MQPLTDPRKLFINRRMGKISHRVDELIEDRSVVTINKNFLNGIEKNPNKTLFDEIEIVPPERIFNMDAIKRIGKRAESQVAITNDEFVKQFYQLLEQSIYSIWDAHKVHLVLFQSGAGGYDSVILVKMIAQLTEQYGKRWLGRTFFTCADCNDAENFNLIMDRFEIDESYRVVYEPYYEDIFTFGKMWKLANGCCGQIDLMTAAIDFTLDIKNVMDLDDVQIFSGRGWIGYNNNIFFQGDPTLQFNAWQLFRNNYYANSSQLLGLLPGQVIVPVLEENVLNLIFETYILFFESVYDDIAQEFSGYKKGNRGSSDVDKYVAKLRDNFDERWKSRLMDMGINADFNYLNLTAASWMEYLTEKKKCLVEGA